MLAGPGSGKTTVITHRILHLIEERKVDPARILVITFSRAAAVEMKTRFETMCRGEHKGVIFGTFHAVFFQILRMETGIGKGSVLTGKERLDLITRLAGVLRPDREEDEEAAAAIAGEISLVKNERIDIDYYYSTSCPEDLFRSLYRAYEKELAVSGRIDFDDMPLKVAALFRDDPRALERWRRQFDWLLVDEFQDINALQFDIVKMLALPKNNLFAVGDDDQSIYRFRGAKPEIMLGFEKDYPDLQKITLEENFRSGAAIVEKAQAVIRENTRRFDKRIICAALETGDESVPSESTENGRSRAGSVEILSLPDPEAESLYLVKLLREASDAGRDITKTALLVRTNLQTAYYAQQLMEMHIPFTLRDTPLCLYDHWICDDLRAYLRLAGNEKMRKDLLRVMNRPNRYLSRHALDTEKVSFDRLEDFYEDRPWMRERIWNLREDLERIGSLPPYAAINYIRKGIGYDAFLEEYARQRRIKEQDLMTMADELQESAARVPSLAVWEEKMDQWRKKLREKPGIGTSGQEMEEGIVITTLHGAKGLEFDEIFLPDVNEDTIPYRKARLEADIEEERRLFYVGMTRAKRRLHIWYVKKRYGRDQYPSRFLKPLIK